MRANIEMVKSLGADKVIDYIQEDLSEYGKVYTVVYDAVDKLPSSVGKKLLTDKGIYIKVGTDDKNVSINDFYFLKELVEAGKLKAVIDRIYPLEKIVDAHRYVEKRHKKGNVVITIESNQNL